VSQNGYLSFQSVRYSTPDSKIPNDIIAPLWTDIRNNTGGQIYYTKYTSSDVLNEINSYIRQLPSASNFSASCAIRVRWQDVYLENDAGYVSFGVLLVSDDQDTSYIMMIYWQMSSLNQPWLAGYKSKNSNHFLSLENSSNLISSSNFNNQALWVFRVDSEPQESCGNEYCTKDEVCVKRSGIDGCACSENNTRPRPDTFDAIEMCESSSGSLSLSRCQLFEAGYAADMLHLNDPMCKGKIQGDRVVFDFDNDNNTCGTTLRTNETHFIYENAVQHHRSGDVGVISRQKWLSVNFSCVYPLVKSISMPMVIEAAHGVVSRELSTEGSYTIRMMPYPNASYIEPYSGNVTLDENQQIFVAVDVEGVDERQIALVIDSCWGTPVNNTNSSLFWPLVSEECPNPQDGTVKVLQNGISTSSRFSFRMFTFTGQSESIYLHCKVHLCLHKESEGSCAHTCGSTTVPARTSRSFQDTTAITMSM
ncbi:hypothetical protein NFI96_027657, partial [Prochilodus magdalenae]